MKEVLTYRAEPKNRPVLLPLSDQWADHPAKKLSPARIQTILDEAEQGNIESMMELASDILERDPTISSALETRALAVQSLEWDILPAKDSGEPGRQQAQRIRKQLDKIAQAYVGMPDASRFLSFDEFLYAKESAQAYGFAPFQIIWRSEDSTIDAFVPFEQRYFRFGKQSAKGSREYNPHQIRIITEADPVDGVTLDRYSWVVHIPKGDMFAPARKGILRKAVYWFIFLNFGVRSMVRYAERTGEPLRLGKYEAGTSPEDQAVLRRAVKELGTDAAAVIAKTSEIEFVGHDRSQTNDIHSRLISLVNAQISKLILGHQSATEGTPGKLGAEDQALQVQSFRIMADARSEESTVNQQVIAPLCLFQDGNVLCYFKRKYEQQDDENAKAEKYEKIGKLVKIPAKHVYDTFNIPEPEPDDETTPDPMMAAFSRTQVYRNAKPPARLRMSKAVKAQARVQSQADAAIQDAQRSVSNALTGVTTEKSAWGNKRQIRRNKSALQSALYTIMRTAITNSGKQAVEAIGGEASLNRISFDLVDDAASKFLDWQAFSVSVIESERITVSLVNALDSQLKQALKEGKTLRKFTEDLLDSASVGNIHSGHLETIFRTNLMTAHNATKLFTLEKNPQAFPAWQFMAILDDRVRDDHAMLDGKIFARDDTANFPPLDYNCRCVASPVDKAEFDEQGYAIDPPEDAAAPEFKNTAVEGLKEWVSDMRAKYPETSKIITQYEERTK